MLGLYIHIPFCAKKCFYCDFNSYEITRKDEKSIYIKNLIKEMEFYKEDFKERKFSSIFLGGGTPSILNEDEINIIFENIYKNYNISENAEITIECNPGTLTKEKLITMKKVGINRLSIGLQTTDNNLLKSIGRIHNYEQFEKNYNDALDVGFKNINIDIMYSLPNQSFDEFKESLDKVIKLNPTHISCYSLILEEGTRFYDMYYNNEFELNDDELDINIYNYTINKLKENGYNQYEISNYSKKGYECKHNITYWKCENYLGLGAGASGYINDYRYSNKENLDEYNKDIENNKKPISEVNNLTKKDEIEEAIIMMLRMNEGINIEDFNKRFNIDFEKKYENVINKLINKGLIDKNKNNIFFTQKGREISNSILVEFLD